MSEPRTADEIAHIKHELEILRTRLTQFIYWGGVLRVVVPGGGYVAAGVLCVGSLASSNNKPELAIAGLIAALIVAVTVWLWCRGLTMRDWVDMASRQHGWGWNGRFASEAEAIEDMIAERVARLAMLRGTA